MADKKINTGLSEAEVHTAFHRALHDLTDAEVRALVSAEAQSRQQNDDRLENEISLLETAAGAEAAARETLQGVVAGEIDNGAKNLIDAASGGCSPPAAWIELPVRLPPGTYTVSFGSLTSTDTDSQYCRGRFFSADTSYASSYFMLPRGNNVSTTVTLTAVVDSLRINPSDTIAHSENDSLSFTDAMICEKSKWDISQKNVPYCPTVQTLYQMILALQSSTPAQRTETEDADA